MKTSTEIVSVAADWKKIQICSTYDCLFILALSIVYECQSPMAYACPKILLSKRGGSAKSC